MTLVIRDRWVSLASGLLLGALHEAKRDGNRRMWFSVCTGGQDFAPAPGLAFDGYCYWESATENGQRAAAAELLAHFDRTHRPYLDEAAHAVHVGYMTTADVPKTVTTRDGYIFRWVACSAAEFGPTGFVRHLAAPGALDTVCASSASHPEIWRGNRSKPACPDCEAWVARIGAA